MYPVERRGEEQAERRRMEAEETAELRREEEARRIGKTA